MAYDAQQVILAHSWTEDSGIDPAGYWMAEKLDGIRAYFDGTHFYSRAGNKFLAPPFFSENLPKDQPLDGELWLGRGRFQQCVSIVKNQKVDRSDEWKEMTYLVFDAPKLNMVYEKRLEYLKSIMPMYGKDTIPTSSFSSTSSTTTKKIPPYSRLVPVQKCLSKTHLLRELNHVQSHGGEGIMLRAPRSRYEFKRSRTLLKVKTFFDEEAIVLAHVKGSGKNSHRMGHITVKTPDGRLFSVGSGFTDAQRDRPPKVGSIITYRFQELSNKLNPRFPTFVGERVDIKWVDYCKTYKPPTLKTATSAKVVSLLKQSSLIFQDPSGDDLKNLTTTAFLDGEDDQDTNVDTDKEQGEEDQVDSDPDYTPADSNPSPPSSGNASASSTNATRAAPSKSRVAMERTATARTPITSRNLAILLSVLEFEPSSRACTSLLEIKTILC
ncbi:hypothetical protein BC939DRAFT_445927 [Gamsiella multidivaricata]|uniref:uncharacterized protein n=1 Tax=Gamsiella multidivaricata TaxID=101098 RepID=UPI002220DD2F|nr:uncharacterized protein BC939DRAFT_445927 [Gamsiella multidivaricata]KAI7827154.1 hypothetical protein BC939DRAFT_445927 [Gamsiella multidivaricata]